jgi:hypothetical protein
MGVYGDGAVLTLAVYRFRMLCERLEDAIQALSVLIERIGEKNTTISQLRALLSKPSTVL